MNDDKKLEVIWVQPMREPQVIEIDNDLESMQELVDGYIEEYMPFEDDAAIVCNEEGKMMGLAPNEDMKKKYMEKFKAPERFFMTAEGIKAVKLDTKNQKSDIRER